jgi:hypothetical protein
MLRAEVEMTINWSQDQPAVLALRKWVAVYFPEVGLHYDAMKTVDPKSHGTVRDHPSHGIGGYVPRTTEKGGFSRHSEGRAGDIYVKVQNPFLKAIGDEAFAGFVANARQLGLEEVIWNGQIWSSTVPHVHAIPAGSDQHTDHVHVAFSRSASQQGQPLVSQVLKGARDAVNSQFP